MRSRAQRISAAAAPPPPPTPLNAVFGRRDSDVSLCSSRPSSAASISRAAPPPSVLLADRKSQAAAIHFINSHLSSLSAPVSLKSSLPSGRDIEEAFSVIASRLDWPIGTLKTDLPLLLASLGCPVKLPSSALKAPGTPHAWPPLLTALHWLTQLSMYADQPRPPRPCNELLTYLTRSYRLFISGYDDAVIDLDKEYLTKTEEHTKIAAGEVAELEKEVVLLEGKVRALTSGPSPREALEEERGLAIKDAGKFRIVLESNRTKSAALEREIKEREGELAAKEDEIRMIRKENAELKMRIDGQEVSARDAERMKRESQVMEFDIMEAENKTAELEEKALEMDRLIAHKFKELEALAEQCNQAIKKLNLATDFKYVLDVEGSSPATVIGIDYKTKFKPALNALSEDLKNSSVSKLEESIALRKHIVQNSRILEEKRGHLVALESKIEALESRMSLLKEKIEDNEAKCAGECSHLREGLETREQQLDTMAKEAERFLQESEQKLRDVEREVDEKTQMCANEVVALIDTVSGYKEHMASIILGMKADLSETVDAVVQAHKASVSAKLVSRDVGQCGSKRARSPSSEGEASDPRTGSCFAPSEADGA